MIVLGRRYCLYTCAIIAIGISYVVVDSKACDPPPYVGRSFWNAKPAKLIEQFAGPIPFVIIHHSYQPAACYTGTRCIEAMQQMQTMHQDVRSWNDIGYSFAVGGDGRVYQGRGFNVIGAHAPRYNNKSVGICLIGDWVSELPPKNMLAATKTLIEYGVRNGIIASNYTLLGHRQVRSTECPGDRLFEEIKTWPHFSPMTDIIDQQNSVS
ncbi:peptidoglycan-recognition protein LB [Anopheles aquasalis]|uniref:peptidoglycan-recognition protein LB n=1 Tax=Anopheles aquasalis TaxID=42839 RepID=UPI00215AA84A|nr:peptidoglycan-recognition protein LB [Anopheles aquasalis]